MTNFEEQVETINLGLPPDCDPDSITWVNGYRRLPPRRAYRDEPYLPDKALDELYEDWERTTERITRLFDEKVWEVSGSVGYAITGSAFTEGRDFRYHIVAYRPAIEAIWQGEKPVFELYDEERDIVAYVHEVPTPEQAVRLLQRHGISTEEADSLRDRLPNIPD